MTENIDKVNSFQKRKRKEEMKKQLISFALMIGFTVISFSLVATGLMDNMFIIPVLLILAIIQVAFQFYFFMHMKDKDHEMPALMIYGGLWVAILVFIALGVISWW
ncbi:cytochrome c oxidase subunit 4 [Virgibacillus natechei]|uniref:Cytochrome c oxidase subunit 4 n=1 Tax=Virgibacillus natechei TaxID=1216297 RepID=A0ABS4IBC1_9BACI|nr:cytochrome c oxidase subunit IVB [Virgibacillus natechei]MBP1968224.1 cytochrome c oxidase subunit 4 [Virgibacillus natechei]UZD14505.1 cytochrome c oxidase subunit IVB [Virgibacillus natechei]